MTIQRRIFRRRLKKVWNVGRGAGGKNDNFLDDQGGDGLWDGNRGIRSQLGVCMTSVDESMNGWEGSVLQGVGN